MNDDTSVGKVGKGVSCSVPACGGAAVRSLSREQLAGSDLQLSEEGRRVYLCQAHYKQWKKRTKKPREFDRLRYRQKNVSKM